MERAFERIELPEGNWWEFWTAVTRGMRKQFRLATMAAVAGKLKLNGTDISNRDALTAEVMAQASNFDLNMVDDGYLVHGTKAWSWERPVDIAFIDSLPDEWVGKVLDRMRVVYAEPTEEDQKKDTVRS